MTLMSVVLLFILFVLAFLYFFGLNPQDVTFFYYPGASITHNLAVMVAGCIILGLFIGYLFHLYSVINHMVRHWNRDRTERRNREVAAIYREGVNRLLSGDMKRARSLLTKALDRDPTGIESLIAMANLHLQEGEGAEAIALLNKARNIDPKSLEVLFKLCAAYEDAGRRDEAVQTYQAILSLEENNRKALRGLRELRVSAGQWRDAIDLQKRVLKLAKEGKRLEEEQRTLMVLRYEVARLSLEQGEIDAAKREFKEIIKQTPEFLPAHVSLGDAYRAERRPDDAVRVWQAGYAALGRGVFLSRLEDLFMAAEDPAGLLSYYREALQDRGDDMVLRFFCGKFCLRLEMIDEALEHLGMVESVGVDSPQLQLLLAEAHRRRNRTEEALNAYKKALGVNVRLRFGYVCDVCGEDAIEWQSRCPSCGTWGSFSIAGRQSLRNAQPLEIRAIHHGEREAWRQE